MIVCFFARYSNTSSALWVFCCWSICMCVISEVQLEQKTVPTAVFGGLKEDWICCCNQETEKIISNMNYVNGLLHFGNTNSEHMVSLFAAFVCFPFLFSWWHWVDKMLKRCFPSVYCTLKDQSPCMTSTNRLLSDSKSLKALPIVARTHGWSCWIWIMLWFH